MTAVGGYRWPDRIDGGMCCSFLTGIVATGFSKQMAMKQSELEDEIEQAMADGHISTDEQARIDRLTSSSSQHGRRTAFAKPG